jgi:hypothetical protein
MHCVPRRFDQGGARRKLAGTSQPNLRVRALHWALRARSIGTSAERGDVVGRSFLQADPVAVRARFFSRSRAQFSGRAMGTIAGRKSARASIAKDRQNLARGVGATRDLRSIARAKIAILNSPYVRWRASPQKKVNESSRASCALTRFSCTLRD